MATERRPNVATQFARDVFSVGQFWIATTTNYICGNGIELD